MAATPSMTADYFSIAFDRLVCEALDYLSKDKDGFFLMAEGAHIDHGGHNNDILYMLNELLAFDEGVKAALDWAKDHEDTVVIVTADHETGGLSLGNNATAETILTAKGHSWSTTWHTSREVYCCVSGAKVDFSNYSDFGLKEKMKNTDTFEMMKRLFLGKAD